MKAFVVLSALALGCIPLPGAIALDPIGVDAAASGVTLQHSSHRWTANARPYLAWRYPGESAWREEHAPRLRNISNRKDATSFQAEFTSARVDVRLARGNANTLVISGTLHNKGAQPIELARFHYLDGIPANTPGFLELQGGDFPRLIHSGDQLRASRPDQEKTWGDMNVFWARLPDPIHDSPNWALSTDTGVFTHAWDRPGWGFGFTGPGTAFGQIGFRTAGAPRFFVGVMLDNVLLDPGESRPLEETLVWYGDWQEGLRQWILSTAAAFHVKSPKPSMTGYCSWYQRAQAVEPHDILRAAKEFATWPVPPGGRTIQVDDGWQIKPGDWRPNAKFASIWRELPGKIEATGSIPGTYLVPSAVHQSVAMAREHPEWMQRLADGQFAIHFANWGGKTYFLEPDRPEVKAYMRSLFTDVREQGWRYVKIDFTYAISTARTAYDRKKTMFQTHRGLYETFRDGAGPDMLLSACVGEPGRYALGLVDVARLGGDIGSNWETVQGNLAHLLTLSATNIWWQGDPDVYYMRAENSKLTEEESYLLTGTLGLFGGLFLTSDWPSQWTGDRADGVREFWNDRGLRQTTDNRVLWSAEGTPLAYRVSYNDGRKPLHRVGIYNWTAETRDVRVRVVDTGLSANLHASSSGRSKSLRVESGTILSSSQPPHSLRIVDFQ